MASVLDETDADLRRIISNLYLLIASTHDYHGPETQRTITAEIKSLIHNLVQLSKSSKRLPTNVSMEIVEYVESARNPDIYTREFVELVMRGNQDQAGTSNGLAQFRDILGSQMMSAIPEINHEVRQVVVATGGKAEQ